MRLAIRIEPTQANLFELMEKIKKEKANYAQDSKDNFRRIFHKGNEELKVIEEEKPRRKLEDLTLCERFIRICLKMITIIILSPFLIFSRTINILHATSQFIQNLSLFKCLSHLWKNIVDLILFIPRSIFPKSWANLLELLLNIPCAILKSISIRIQKAKRAQINSSKKQE